MTNDIVFDNRCVLYRYIIHCNYSVGDVRVDIYTYCCVALEGHIYGAAPGTERIYNTLTDKEANGDADCNLDHAKAE